METKKHIQAQKKLNSAIQTFVTATKEVDNAVSLIDVSIVSDKKRIEDYEGQIKSLEQAIDEVQANVLSKERERLSYIELKDRLKHFTGGNE